ncbi:hypothetical protein HDU79_002868 [Rhizoclosmatium sp. JEL0117]|nr:hypothetical protein HDU79_002868 [Rhizoclosmatium sp. JEL0117]
MRGLPTRLLLQCKLPESALEEGAQESLRKDYSFFKIRISLPIGKTTSVRKSYTIHIVNVDFATCFNSSGWEEVLHNFGSLVNLNLVFIGPDMEGLMSNQYQPIAMTCCDDCQAKGRRRQHATVATSYLDYLRDPRRINADLIFLPNSGYAENPLVSSVEVALVQTQNLPVCFTTFDKTEAADEVKLFKDVLMKRSCHENWDHIVINEPNPFYGMIPVIDSTAQGEGFFYFNSVVDMFRPRLQK